MNITCGRVVGSCGLHFNSVISVSEFCESETSDLFEIVDSGQELVVMSGSAKTENRASEQIELNQTRQFWNLFSRDCATGREWGTKMKIQWGSKLRTSLYFEWLKRSWVANCTDFEWDLKSGSPTIWNPGKWLPFCQKPFEIQTKTSGFWIFQFSNGWGYSYILSKSQTIWKPEHLKSDLQKVKISNGLNSDPHCKII